MNTAKLHSVRHQNGSMHLRLILLAVLIAAVAHADELTKSVQNTLKDQGFFYGEVTGVNGPETAAAVKRYQIRNGLEVTGTLTNETLEALGVGGAPPVPTQPSAPAPETKAPTRRAEPVERQTRTPNHLRKNDSAEQSDREYLKRRQSSVPPATAEPEREPEAVRPPAPTGGGAFSHLFAETPYASAPLEVQQSTVKQAQRFLRNLNMYEDNIDGLPGPALEEGILEYQRFVRLPLTGQLDLETLAAMRLLPGRGGFPTRPEKPAVRIVPGSKAPLRGVWIR